MVEFQDVSLELSVELCQLLVASQYQNFKFWITFIMFLPNPLDTTLLPMDTLIR